MNRIVIYTAVTGDYDDLSPLIEEDEIDYICFTDNNFTGIIPKPWKQIRLPGSKFSNKDLARFCKINPHRLLPQYDKSLWIDGNIIIKGNIKKFIVDTLNSHDIASYDHWWRDKTEQELFECARSGFDPAWKLRKQLSRYSMDGYISNNFYENNVLFRNHMKSDVINMHNTWWEEYIKGGKRDQYSFTYSAYKNDVNIYSLGVHDPRVKKNIFDYKEHKRKRPFKQYVLIIINRIYIKLFSWKIAPPMRENILLKNKIKAKR
ncbi:MULTISPECIES: glycosyltransferase domain-containing protein [unclassified Leclercia]|uniref:glycosyltransferase domain-containing protein n=1 Tax=unclassified Leclercia TaxID=2627398 RepID=UPI00257FA580|nr:MULTISPECIES: glycosyltransferase domain-containing protein [unclassified Leclercia]